MKITIIAVGHRMPDWVETAWNDYQKRLPVDWPIMLKEIKPEPRTTGKTPAQMMAAEAKRIEAAIPEHCIKVALDEHGKDLSTKRFTDQISSWHDQGDTVALIIGGPDGLDDTLKANCQSLIRLSSLTMPHPMVRVMLIEQIYRAWSLLNNHPYHRA